MSAPALERSGRRMAIIDDDPNATGATAELVREAGYEPIILAQQPDLDAMVAAVIGRAQVAICDQRLRYHWHVPFHGAETVAALFGHRLPALLISQFGHIDVNAIRPWRSKIPVLLARADLDAERIRTGIELCEGELAGHYQSSRRTWRTLVRIEDVDRKEGQDILDVIIPAWNPADAVQIEGALLPDALRGKLARDVRLFARVNIGAERAEDLFFTDFELAPEPPPDVDLG